jgi:hypothetical protein
MASHAPLDWSKLAELKTVVQTTADFAHAWHVFFDHFGEKSEFIRLGAPVSDPQLVAMFEGVLRHCAEKHLGTTCVSVKRLMLIEVRDHGLIHGPAMVDGWVAGLLYFTDLAIGMISLSRRGAKLAHFSRFTLDLLRG